MAPVVASVLSILLLGVSRATADYTNFQWTNTSVPNCPKTGGECIPPAICARNDPQGVWYCCVPGNKDEVCHTIANSCDGGGKGIPSGAQQSCSSGNNAFCCLKDSQQCTQAYGQINICWASSTLGNPVASLNATMMNETYKSLVAAKPSQASYTIALAALQSLTSTTTGASSSTPATTNSASTSGASSGTPSTSPTGASSSSESKSGLSGGAIGGIVGGVVGGLALIGAIAFLLWRRKKYSTVAQAVPNSPSNGPVNTAYQGHGYQQNAAEVPAHNMSNVPPTEKYANHGYTSEMPAYQQPAEMSAHRY